MVSQTAAIVVVGDEILSGHTQDTNSHWLAQRVRRRGVRLLRIETIPDDEAEIETTVRRNLERDAPTFLFVVGGIGPTPDDRTYEGVRRALGVELDVRPEHVAALRKRYKALGRARPDLDPERAQAVRRMIQLPKGAEPLANPVGAALGCVATSGASRLVVLPGVPRELYAMFDRSFAPRHLDKSARAETVRELEVWGVEAALWDTLETVGRENPAVRVGSYPQDDRGRIILRLSGGPAEVRNATRRLRELLKGSEKRKPRPKNRVRKPKK